MNIEGDQVSEYNLEKSLRQVSFDPIAETARRTLETIGKGLVVIEVFQGWYRADPQKTDQRLVVTCPDMVTARRLKANLGEGEKTQFVVAHPHMLPFARGEAKAMVDAHLVSHVGHDATSLTKGSEAVAERVSPTLGLTRFDTKKSLADFARELAVLLRVPNISRPEYLTAQGHEQMKEVLVETLKNRAQILGENGTLVASFAAAYGDQPHKDAYAVHQAVGEIVLTFDEIQEVMGKAGLTVKAVTAGIAPKKQAVAVESAAKVLLISILGKERFSKIAVDKIIPVAHRALGLFDRVLPKQKREESVEGETVGASGIGAR